jgi:hypothetical protein
MRIFNKMRNPEYSGDCILIGLEQVVNKVVTKLALRIRNRYMQCKMFID